MRTHLSALVNHMIVSPDSPCDAGHGLTARIWEQYLQDSIVRLGLARSAVGQTEPVRGLSGHPSSRPTHLWGLKAVMTPLGSAYPTQRPFPS